MSTDSTTTVKPVDGNTGAVALLKIVTFALPLEKSDIGLALACNVFEVYTR
jgi:hypothetical protein